MAFAMRVFRVFAALLLPLVPLVNAKCPAAASTLAQSLPIGGGTWSLAPGAVDTHTALIDLVNGSENTVRLCVNIGFTTAVR